MQKKMESSNKAMNMNLFKVEQYMLQKETGEIATPHCENVRDSDQVLLASQFTVACIETRGLGNLLYNPGISN